MLKLVLSITHSYDPTLFFFLQSHINFHNVVRPCSFHLEQVGNLIFFYFWGGGGGVRAWEEKKERRDNIYFIQGHFNQFYGLVFLKIVHICGYGSTPRLLAC